MSSQHQVPQFGNLLSGFSKTNTVGDKMVVIKPPTPALSEPPMPPHAQQQLLLEPLSCVQDLHHHSWRLGGIVPLCGAHASAVVTAGTKATMKHPYHLVSQLYASSPDFDATKKSGQNNFLPGAVPSRKHGFAGGFS
eukprot:1161616-Pelagomonas_calceolata.AAC.2